MNTIAFIIILLIIIGIIFVLFHYIRDYLNYKSTVDTNLSIAQSAINSEKTDRVKNLKYIVDQVNTVNDQVYNVTNQNILNQQQIESQLDASQSNIIAGLNSAFTFTDSNNNPISIIDLPGYMQPNLNLLNNVTATMNLTAQNMNLIGTAQMCSINDPTKCIQFPDKDGNTYLTDMGNGNITLDATNGTDIYNGVNLFGNLNINSKSGESAALINTTNPNSINIQTNKLGVGDFDKIAKLNATLHINASSNISTANVFELSTNQGHSLMSVDPNGTITMYYQGAVIGTIEPISQAENGPGLKITATNVTIDGNLDVNGTIIGSCTPAPPPPAPQLVVTQTVQCANGPSTFTYSPPLSDTIRKKSDPPYCIPPPNPPAQSPQTNKVLNKLNKPAYLLESNNSTNYNNQNINQQAQTQEAQQAQIQQPQQLSDILQGLIGRSQNNASQSYNQNNNPFTNGQCASRH